MNRWLRLFLGVLAASVVYAISLGIMFPMVTTPSRGTSIWEIFRLYSGSIPLEYYGYGNILEFLVVQGTSLFTAGMIPYVMWKGGKRGIDNDSSMRNLLYFTAAGLAILLGYAEYQWYSIFVTSAVMAIGHLAARVSQTRALADRMGNSVYVRLISINTVVLAIFTAPLYFLGRIIA